MFQRTLFQLLDPLQVANPLLLYLLAQTLHFVVPLLVLPGLLRGGLQLVHHLIEHFYLLEMLDPGPLVLLSYHQHPLELVVTLVQPVLQLLYCFALLRVGLLELGQLQVDVHVRHTCRTVPRLEIT